MSLSIDILKPNFKLLPVRERVLCALGALFGLEISSAFSWWVLGGFNAWYIAPMGASSVLLFAVPSSPLAQPWNIVVGNTLAAFIGVLCAQYIPEVTLAFSIAVALAIFLMMSSDSLHPPSGAVAMTAVLGGASVHQLGFKFIAYPVLLNSLLLLAVAVIFNFLFRQNNFFIDFITEICIIMVEKVGNLLMFPAFHNVEQSDQKSGFQKDMYSLFLQIDTILHTAKGKR